ncbi:hypothetical protein [Natronomonas gomsonensis]|uniref:hypothetical protein n=1 Tax=Natronomonas gomsonensis TaxID=1046043 RepID=UPI0015BBDF35|nr:hypothetical protein [Natronomonas gomsonensis]
MATRRQLLTAIAATTPLLAGCSKGPVDGINDENQRQTPKNEATSDEIETLSEDPECSNPDEQSRLIVTPRGVSVVAETKEAAESFTAELGPEMEFEIVETGDEYAVEVRSDAISIEELRSYTDDRSDLGPVRVGLTTPTLRRIAQSVRDSLDQSEDVSAYSVYRIRTGESESDRIVAVINIQGAEGLSPSSDVTFYAESDGERRTLVDKSLFQVTEVTEDNNRILVHIQLTETGRTQYRNRLREVVDLQGQVGQVLYIDVGGETVWNGGISRQLAEAIRSGEWSGEFSVVFPGRDEASAFTSTVNLIQLSVPAETRLERC